MVVPTSDLTTLEKVAVSSFNVTTYQAAFSKQARVLYQAQPDGGRVPLGGLIPEHAVVFSS